MAPELAQVSEINVKEEALQGEAFFSRVIFAFLFFFRIFYTLLTSLQARLFTSSLSVSITATIMSH
jgi:hypothetical protein